MSTVCSIYLIVGVNLGVHLLLQKVKGQLLEDVQLVLHLGPYILRSDNFLRKEENTIYIGEKCFCEFPMIKSLNFTSGFHCDIKIVMIISILQIYFV